VNGLLVEIVEGEIKFPVLSKDAKVGSRESKAAEGLVEDRLANLQSMLAGEPRIVRAEIAKHVQKITLTPEGRMYIASGTRDLLGGVAVTMVPGARIELATPAFSGRRSTNELPRHTTLVV
jgi:hypothetical protein